MTFAADLTNDLSIFYNTDEFGKSATYILSGGSGTEVTVIIDDADESLQDPAPDGDTMNIRVRESEVAAPNPQGDTFTINSETWYVIGNQGGPDDGEWKLRLSRSERRRI